MLCFPQSLFATHCRQFASVWKMFTMKAVKGFFPPLSIHSSPENRTCTDDEPEVRAPLCCCEAAPHPCSSASFLSYPSPDMQVLLLKPAVSILDMLMLHCVCPVAVMYWGGVGRVGGGGEVRQFKCVWYATSNKPHKVALWSSVRLFRGTVSDHRGEGALGFPYMTYRVCSHQNRQHVWRGMSHMLEIPVHNCGKLLKVSIPGVKVDMDGFIPFWGNQT